MIVNFPLSLFLHGAAQPQPNCFAWRFLGVLRDLAVNLESGINRQDSKSAKNFAKQNSFQEGKDVRLSSTDRLPL